MLSDHYDSSKDYSELWHFYTLQLESIILSTPFHKQENIINETFFLYLTENLDTSFTEHNIKLQQTFFCKWFTLFL